MKKALRLSALAFVCIFVLIALSTLVSCTQDPMESIKKTPTIRGNVTIPSGANVKGSDFYIRIMEGENAVYTGKVKDDGSFAVEGLDETKTYSILLSTEELGEINTSSREVEVSRDIARATTTSGYGGWLKNVTASVNEQAGVGSIKVKPLGTIKGVAKRSGEEEHSDIMVYIPGTSYMAVTDANGNYSIFNVPQSSSTYNLRCISLTGDWLPEVITGVLLYSDSDTENPVKTVPERSIVKNAGNLLGTIIKTAATDNSNITVLIQNDEFSETGTTAADGSLRITGILPGTYKVTISSTGFVTQTIDNVIIRAAKDTSIGEKILIANGGSIQGMISLSDDSSKAGVLITAKSVDGSYSYTTSSDSDGRFILADVYPGTYSVTLTRTGYADASRTAVKVESGNIVSLGTIALASEFGSLTGRIVDPDGNPVSGVSVMIGDVATVTTRDTGIFEKSGLAVGTYSLSISKYGYNNKTVENIEIQSSQTTELAESIIINPLTGRIYGRVEKDGASDFSGVTVTVSGNGRSKSTTTDSEGYYSIDALPGTYNTIDFNCGCWSAQYSLQNQILLSVDDEVQIPDYRLMSHHSFGLFEQKPSTCTEAGYEKYRCWTCGFEKTEYLPMTEHNMLLVDHLDATCTAAGWKEFECSICGHSTTETEAAKGHSWGKPIITVAATCHSTGSQEVTCTTCGATGTQTIDKLPHAWVDNGYHDGQIEYVCSNCGETEYADDSTAILNISDWGSVSLKPSVDPNSVKTLIIPSEIDGMTVTSVFNHTFQDCVNITKIVLPNTLTTIEDWAFAGCIGVTEIELPASLERIGEHAFRGCTSLKSIEIPAGLNEINHYAFYGCSSLASVTLPETITMLGRECFAGCSFDRIHIPDSVENIVCYAFCDNTNLKEVLIPRSVKYMDDRPFMGCWNLETVYIQSETQPSGWVSTWNDTSARIVWGYTGDLHYAHIESTEWNISSTYHWHECTECGEVLSMAKHEYTDEVTKQPTCTETGIRTYTCTMCGQSYTEEVPALGHDYHSEVTVPATCTEKGELTYTCSRCDSTYTEEIVSHHEYEEVITTAATCTTDGQKTLTCSVCGDSKTEVIPATGHSYKETVIPATCTEAGTTIHKCEHCGDTYEEEIPATGHNYVASITKQATCEEDGIKTFTCSRCSDSYTETINAYGHYFTSSTIVKEATCSEPGIKSSKCFRCGKTVNEEIPKLEHDPVFAADEANHWTQCSHCGEILVPKVTHTFIETEGDYICKDCGYSDSSLYYQVDSNGVLTPKDKSVLPSVVRIPSNINGQAVTAIGDQAFTGCTGITTLFISKGIVTIGTDAFSGCSALAMVSLPDDLKEINRGAFWECIKLKSITFPDSLNRIGDYAFYGSGILSVEIPENLTSVGCSIFDSSSLQTLIIPASIDKVYEGFSYNCQQLTSISYGGTVSEWYQLEKGKGWRENVPATTVTCSDGSVELGNYEVDSEGKLNVIDKTLIGSVFEVPSIVDGKTVTGLSSECLKFCDNLETLILPETVTSLGFYSLWDCNNLQSIEGFENITLIDYPFLGEFPYLETLYAPNVKNWYGGVPKHVKSLTISNKLEELPSMAGCEQLSEIVFLGTVAEWNRYEKINGWHRGVPATYVECSDGNVDITQVLSIKADGTLSCYDSSELPANYEIPSEVNGITVKALDNSFLSDSNNFESIVVPEGVTKIGDNSFGSCHNLRMITLPSTITQLGAAALKACEKLESVVIPGGLNRIENQLFSECYNLTSIFFQGTVEKWGSMFKDWEWNLGVPAEYVVCLDGVAYINEENGVFSVTDDGTLRCSDYSKLSSDIVIPAYVGNKKVETLAKEMFKGTSITSVSVSEGITAIGESCFADCTNLKSVSLPSSLKTIWYDAFVRCSSLESIVIPAGVDALHGSAFAGCTSLSSVTLPTSLTYLSGCSFGWCTSLESLSIPNNIEDIHGDAFDGAGLISIDIPNSVRSIGSKAFYDCASLESVSISKNISEIPAEVFKNCQNLETIAFKGTVAQWNSIPKGSQWNMNVPATKVVCIDGEVEITNMYIQGNTLYCTDTSKLPSEIVIPSTYNGVPVRKLADGMFRGDNHIVSVVIPEGVTEIGSSCFQECNNLVSVSVPSTVTTIGSEAFHYCEKLTTVNLPYGLTIIEPDTLSDCISLSSISIPDTVKEIGYGAFHDYPLSSVVIPDSVEKIGWVAFFCSKLTSLEIPDSVTYIDSEAFAGSYLLESVVLSGNLTSIPSKLFENCTSLNSIMFNGTVEQWNALQKGGRWHAAVPATSVICLDGEVPFETVDVQRGPAGGYIIYDCDADNASGNADGLISTECGWRYLEASPDELDFYWVELGYHRNSNNGANLFVNGTETYNASNCTGTAIGTGQRNTQLLLAAMGEAAYAYESGSDKESNYAAKLCDNLEYTHDGVVYDDWFLPSKDELNLMYNILYVNGIGGFQEWEYWSSSEYPGDARLGWEQWFPTGEQWLQVSRADFDRVRPIRAFL